MDKKLLYYSELNNYFLQKDYNCIKPFPVENNNDTIFLTAGIQPILKQFRENNLLNSKKVYVSQPVIRTQFMNSLSEGSSLAFINSTTAGFNISENEHKNLVKDWLELFSIVGLKSSNITTYSKNYERIWGDLLVSGEKTFYYYNGLELGDTTFFTKISKDNCNIGIETISDVGFGLERIRWCVNKSSYFDLYSDSSAISPPIKAYLSALALLCVNDIKPSNKNAGYRYRMFSKKLAFLLNGHELSFNEEKYLIESIRYWSEWQKNDNNVDIILFKKEYVRNCNRYIIDTLNREGYKNLSGIDINISREEMQKRLISSGVKKEKIKKLYK